MPQKCFVDYETSPNFLLTSRHGVNFHFWGELIHETKNLNTVFFFFFFNLILRTNQIYFYETLSTGGGRTGQKVWE